MERARMTSVARTPDPKDEPMSATTGTPPPFIDWRPEDGDVASAADVLDCAAAWLDTADVAFRLMLEAQGKTHVAGDEVQEALRIMAQRLRDAPGLNERLTEDLRDNSALPAASAAPTQPREDQP